MMACLLLAAVDASAQAQTSIPGSISGRVVDAVTGAPIPTAMVTLEAAGAPALLIDGQAGVPIAAVRSAVTAETGAYRFADLLPGWYRLRVERLGYRSATLEVEVRRPGDAIVSVGLGVLPVELEPLQVVQQATALFQRASDDIVDAVDARIAAERERQELFLTPDARVVTYSDVTEGVTLGEGDVFRALQRFPGIGTRDDYTAELWTRGAPWTQTRVTFDGVPLFNPVHAVGVLSAITPEVLGTVFFHPGVRPASLPEGAAGTVDLRSRPASGNGEIRGVADLSMASSKLAVEQNLNGRGSWVLAARRSHLSVLSGGIDWLGLDTLSLPYLFHDLAGRVDVQLGGQTHLEASGLWEEDRLTGDVPGVLERTQAHWGNRTGRVTLRTRVGDVELSQTVGHSYFAAHTDERVVRTDEKTAAWTEPESHNEIRHFQLAGDLRPVGGDGPARWSAGYDVASSGVDYDGPLPRYHAVQPDTVGHLRISPDLIVVGAWAESRIDLGGGFTINPGLRAELADGPRNIGTAHWSPRLAVRVATSADQTISLGIGRSWQYLQAIALGGPSIHPAFHASHFWLLANRRYPAIRSDLASVGLERWLGDGWLGSATGYVRRASDVTVPDPSPGRLLRRPQFVPAENVARGFELGLRRIGARWSASLGYGFAISEMAVDSLRFPAPADRRHLVDAMLGVGLTPALRLSAAFSAMSGAPFTRAYTRTPADCSTFGFGCDNPNGSWVDAANAERTPPYRSLDASLHWTRAFRGVGVGAYLQVRNVLGTDNASTYAGSYVIGRRTVTDRNGDQRIVYRWADRFEPGLPRLPLVGFRLTF
jgi:hypothetical protein